MTLIAGLRRFQLIRTVVRAYLPPAIIHELCETIFAQFPKREEIEIPVGI